MLLNGIPKLMWHNTDVALVLLTYPNNHITPKMINDCIFVYSLVSITSDTSYISSTKGRVLCVWIFVIVIVICCG